MDEGAISEQINSYKLVAVVDAPRTIAPTEVSIFRGDAFVTLVRQTLALQLFFSGGLNLEGLDQIDSSFRLKFS